MGTGSTLLLVFVGIRENINLNWKKLVLNKYSQECWIPHTKLTLKKRKLLEKPEGLPAMPSIFLK